jgi:putative thioredoxin
MTAPQFSRPGAIDLSALRKPPTPAGGPPTSAAWSGQFVLDVTSEESLRTDVVERSLSVVVVVSFWSPQVPASVEINTTLETLADEFKGAFLLARVDISAQPQLAQLLGIPQVPLVVAALRGQLAPLIQESLPLVEMRELVRQVLDAAAANGVAGTAEGTSAPGAPQPPAAPDPEPVKHPAAEAALLSGDLDAAVAGYDQALAAAPGDVEAALGLARAKLLKRTHHVDTAQARAAAAAHPHDVQAQALVADLDLIGGHVEDAFARLIDLVRRSAGDERDAARKHLIEMFALVGDDDNRVKKARQLLASALF